MRTRTRENKKELPIYVVAVLIALSGIGILSLAVYYLAFLPVPYPIQSLKVRVLTTLQLEEVLHRDFDFAIIDKEGGVDILKSPEEEAEVLMEEQKDALYRKVEEHEEWIKVRSEDGSVEGWLRKEDVRIIER